MVEPLVLPLLHYQGHSRYLPQGVLRILVHGHPTQEQQQQHQSTLALRQCLHHLELTQGRVSILELLEVFLRLHPCLHSLLSMAFRHHLLLRLESQTSTQLWFNK